MRIEPTRIPAVKLIQPSVFKDERGFFLETFQQSNYAAEGIGPDFPQDNLSGSRQGTLRGLHFQIKHVQGKLIQAVKGDVFDVAVDLRRSSANFGDWVGVLLSAESHHQLWIPPGFAHGFYVLSDWAEVYYKVTDVYSPEHERTLRWNDQHTGIEWPLIDGLAPLVSEKDAAGLSFTDIPSFD